MNEVVSCFFFLPLQADSAHYLEWLKTLKECHGSVETSSMSLAAAINNKGIYTVGNIEPQHKGKVLASGQPVGKTYI